MAGSHSLENPQCKPLHGYNKPFDIGYFAYLTKYIDKAIKLTFRVLGDKPMPTPAWRQSRTMGMDLPCLLDACFQAKKESHPYICIILRLQIIVSTTHYPLESLFQPPGHQPEKVRIQVGYRLLRKKIWLRQQNTFHTNM